MQMGAVGRRDRAGTQKLLVSLPQGMGPYGQCLGWIRCKKDHGQNEQEK